MPRKLKRFSVPYRTHRADAKTKAEIELRYIDGKYVPSPRETAPRVEFTAFTIKEAQQRAQELILPKDKRPLLGRSNIGICIVKDEP